MIIVLMGLGTLGEGATKSGKHKGEVKQLDVSIEFSKEYGTTVTNEKGTFYHVWGYVFYENKVYPPEYWGLFPLYFFGREVGVKVTVTNKGPRNRAKLLIVTESYVLKTDGSNGAQLKEPEAIVVDLRRGETKTIDASFTVQWTPEADSGLDRFLVKVYHLNQGGGPGNEDPALIMVKEGVFCPPEYTE